MIKLKFWQIENMVLMKVLETEESLRCKVSLGKYNGIEFNSYYIPAFHKSKICLRGRNKKYDHRICSYNFVTTEEATEWIAKATEAVRLFNIDHTKVEDNTDDDVKTFIAE